MAIRATPQGSNVGRHSRCIWLLVRYFGGKRTQFTGPEVDGVMTFSGFMGRDSI